MAAPTVHIGGICGWTPIDDDCDVHYTTISDSTRCSTSNHDLSAASFSSTPRAIRNSTPRSPSLESHPRESAESSAEGDCSEISPYHNPTSLRRYKLKLSRDPNWAPRPPNAFILFRRTYAEKHKGEEVQLPEKLTLSKRASAAWRSLTPQEKRPWYDAAKEGAAEHMRRNPNYVYKPNKKTRSDHRRHPALLSRREQVEAFVRKTTTRRSRLTTKRGRAAQCPTPISVASSASPEPPNTPADQEFSLHFEHGSRSRSNSIATPEPQVACPIPIQPGGNNALLSETAVEPTSSILERPGFFRKGYSYPEGVFDYAPMDYLVYDHGYPESSDDFSSQSFDSSASSPMAYFGDASPDYWSSPNQGGIPLQMPDPQVQPYQSASYTPLPSAPLMERRRQSETMSTVPSPLTVITSSLSGWTRDDLVTSRMVPPADQGTARPPEMPKTMPDPSAPSPPFLSATEYGFNDSMDPSAPYLPLRGDLLAVPTLDAELDRTPRDASFHSSASPANDLATSTTMRHPYRDFPGALGLPSSGGFMAPLYGLDTAADFESYNIGLRQYGIYAPHEVYATPDEAVNPYLLSFNNFVEYI